MFLHWIKTERFLHKDIFTNKVAIYEEIIIMHGEKF